MHPLNLGLRFAIELVALAALAVWGRAHGDGALRLVLMVGVPALAAGAWSTFTVPGDPSRGDHGRVPVPGWVRLLLEGIIFALAVGALLDLGWTDAPIALGVATVVHYAGSWRRVRWLLGGDGPAGARVRDSRDNTLP